MRKRQINRAGDKYTFWDTIRMMQLEFQRENSNIGFTDWVTEKYGISIDVVEGGMYAPSYKIINEAKHTFYKLKYG